MLLTTSAIVLSKIKYGDGDLIVKCYTKKSGVVSYMIKGTLKSKKNNKKVSYFQPLSLLQLVTTHKSNRAIQFIKEVKAQNIYHTLHTNIVKGTIVLFLTEILNDVLKEEEENIELYQYLETAFKWLDENNESANFHLLFLIKLTQYLGFYPDDSSLHLPYFNLEEGQFENTLKGVYSISGENLTVLKLLLGTTFDAINTIKINSKQRQSFLNMILLYFELHLGSFKKPKSLLILNQVFN